MRKILTTVLAAAVLALANGTAWADTCYETAQVNIDCSPKGLGSTASQGSQVNVQAVHTPSQNLRDTLRNALSGGDTGTSAGTANSASGAQFDQRITDARAQVDAALADPNAPGAQDRYNAAMANLHAAYGDAEKAFPNQADSISQSENQDAAAASQRAANAGWNAPAAADAAPAKPAGPDNVTAVGSTVYVCDGAIAGANNVSCRAISADGQCTGVTLADGGVGWQDSIATPCQDGDLSQRQAFLNGNSDDAAAVQQAPPGFSMDPAETDAEIKRLTAAPPPERDVDGGEDSDWNDAMADDDTPPSIEDARAETPIDPSTFASNNDNDGGPSIDDAIDMLNAASSILGAASAIAGSGSVPSAPSFHSAPTFRAPSRPPPQFQYHPAPANNSTITGTTGH
jgi:hypothetical protein